MHACLMRRYQLWYFWFFDIICSCNSSESCCHDKSVQQASSRLHNTRPVRLVSTSLLHDSHKPYSGKITAVGLLPGCWTAGLLWDDHCCWTAGLLWDDYCCWTAGLLTAQTCCGLLWGNRLLPYSGVLDCCPLSGVLLYCCCSTLGLRPYSNDIYSSGSPCILLVRRIDGGIFG